MHFLANKTNEPPTGFAYWRDLILGGVGAVLILRSLWDFIDWFENHGATEKNGALGFLVGYGLLALLAPRRFRFVVFSLITLVGWGILGAISHPSLAGLPVVACSALLAYVLLRWKGHLLK